MIRYLKTLYLLKHGGFTEVSEEELYSFWADKPLPLSGKQFVMPPTIFFEWNEFVTYKGAKLTDEIHTIIVQSYRGISISYHIRNK